MRFEPYPFEKLATLLQGVSPEQNEIALTIGEPQFETPLFIQEALANSTKLLNKYPKTAGEEYLREAQRGFVLKRFGVELENSELIPTFGTREVLFNFPQFYLFDKQNPTIGYVNPFYQIYEGSAIASRANVVYIGLEKENGFLPQIDKEALKKCDMVILNSPSNPTATDLNLDELCEWVKASLECDFLLLNDECYSEIYFDTPPPSLLEASLKVGNSEFKNILVVNSISKRSSAPALRSGFIAGDKNILKEYAKYRTYIGCASPLPLQIASAAAWADELHVESIREIYKASMKKAVEILGIKMPSSTFYVWLEVGDDETFTKELYAKTGVKVLCGRYLGRDGFGKGFVRLALVHDEATCEVALKRVEEFLKGWK